MANSYIAFSNFTRVEEQEIIKTVRAVHSNTCELDPIPTTLLKDILPKVAPLMEALVNKFLNTGTFNDSLKEALVHLLLKKINLDPLDNNYHPVSNLSFLSKAIENMVALQLVKYVDSNDHMEPNQSAFRRNHSTETTLLKIKSDLVWMFLILFNTMKVELFSQKQNLNFVERQAVASFKHGFFQV